MKLGLVMTIRNERAQLRPNLLYHHFVGVDRVYLYHDRCTDGSLDTVDDLPFVRIAPTTDRDQLRGRPESAYYIEHYNVVLARQALNAIHTLDLAAENDLDWLVHIDADELVCPHREQVSAGALKRFLEELDDEIECVRFPPFEVCSRRLEYEQVFAEETLFTPPGSKGTRRLYNPITKSHFDSDLALGHRKGKCAVRVGRGMIPRGPHEFRRRDGSEPSTVTRGLLLHYYLHSFSQFVQKFRNMFDRPDYWIHSKPIRPQKRLWRDMVNNGEFSEDELRAYFEQWVQLDEAQVRKRRRGFHIFGVRLRKPTLVEINAIARAFESISDLQPAEQTGREKACGHIETRRSALDTVFHPRRVY